MILIDVNVLLYAHNEADIRHKYCVRWLESVRADGELLGIPWHCFLAFMRLATAPGAVSRPLSRVEAARAVEGWLNHPQVVIPTPGSRFWKILQEVGADAGTKGRGWSDAYLAALAIENGAALATFDRDFRKFRELKLVELEEMSA